MRSSFTEQVKMLMDGGSARNTEIGLAKRKRHLCIQIETARDKLGHL